MAHLINLKTIHDHRGQLTVIDQVLPFDIKRVYYIQGAHRSVRGEHRHKITKQAAVCIKGSCRILTKIGNHEQVFFLNRPDKCLILRPEDWHKMYDFSPNAILMVLASENYNKEDYIHLPIE